METIAINSKSSVDQDLISSVDQVLIENKYENITIPNFITYITLVFSLGGIYLLLKGNFLIGALLVWTLCDVFDTLDGYVAKKFKMFSPLGADLDSLVDVIAFLIPPFLISLHFGSDLLLIAAFFFVFTGIYRLARFNVVKTSNGDVVGLQASLAAHMIYLSILINIPSNYLSIIFIVLSLLMISPVRSKSIYSLYLTGVLMALNVFFVIMKLW